MPERATRQETQAGFANSVRRTLLPVFATGHSASRSPATIRLPLCEAAGTQSSDFLFACKPAVHITLTESVADSTRAGARETHRVVWRKSKKVFADTSVCSARSQCAT